MEVKFVSTCYLNPCLTIKIWDVQCIFMAVHVLTNDKINDDHRITSMTEIQAGNNQNFQR